MSVNHCRAKRAVAPLILTALLTAIPITATHAADLDFDKLLTQGKNLYARGREELIIRHFFRDRSDGVFLDVGCFQPTRNSTTYYLERHLGWSGIAIDAQKELAPLWKKQRPRATFFPFVVTDRSGETMTFYKAAKGRGLSSTNRKDIEDWAERHGNRDLAIEVLKLPTIALNDLLEQEGVEKIDFLSMDINGSEPAALAAFDINRFRPELVHIEVYERNRKGLSDYFERNGYRRIDEYMKYDRNNWYFTPKITPNVQREGVPEATKNETAAK